MQCWVEAEVEHLRGKVEEVAKVQMELEVERARLEEEQGHKTAEREMQVVMTCSFWLMII